MNDDWKPLLAPISFAASIGGAFLGSRISRARKKRSLRLKLEDPISARDKELPMIREQADGFRKQARGFQAWQARPSAHACAKLGRVSSTVL